MFVDAHHARTGIVRTLRTLKGVIVLIPALNGGRADVVRARELSLSYAAMVSLKHLQAVAFGGGETWFDIRKAVPEIATTCAAMILGRSQV